MGKHIVVTGKRYGRLVALEEIRKNNRLAYLCECDCGELKLVLKSNLVSGKIRSCGCLRRENSARLAQGLTQTIHGQSKTPLYKVWAAMKDRCYNERSPEYHNYGGRGITICVDWLNSFESFYDWSIKNGYRQGLTIDRINGGVEYAPGNCRWTTAKVQGNNTRRNHLLEYNGEVHTVAEWADIKGINYNTLNGRIHRGWTIERALTTKVS